jgi:hypothetical protein
VFVAGGCIAAQRTLPPGGGAFLEIEAGLASCRRVLGSDPGSCLDELFLVGTFLRRPPPELQIVPLEKDAILRAAARVTAPVPKRKAHDKVTEGPRSATLW